MVLKYRCIYTSSADCCHSVARWLLSLLTEEQNCAMSLLARLFCCWWSEWTTKNKSRCVIQIRALWVMLGVQAVLISFLPWLISHPSFWLCSSSGHQSSPPSLVTLWGKEFGVGPRCQRLWSVKHCVLWPRFAWTEFPWSYCTLGFLCVGGA